jgi:hypothetical protein
MNNHHADALLPLLQQQGFEVKVLGWDHWDLPADVEYRPDTGDVYFSTVRSSYRLKGNPARVAAQLAVLIQREIDTQRRGKQRKVVAA